MGRRRGEGDFDRPGGRHGRGPGHNRPGANREPERFDKPVEGFGEQEERHRDQFARAAEGGEYKQRVHEHFEQIETRLSRVEERLRELEERAGRSSSSGESHTRSPRGHEGGL